MAEVSPRPFVVLYWTVKGLQVKILPLQVEEGEYGVSSVGVSTAADHSRRHDLKCTHDGGEEGEGRKYNEFHG